MTDPDPKVHALNDAHLADQGLVEGKEAANSRLKRRYWRACVKTLTPWLEGRPLAVIRKFDRQIRAEAALHNGKIAKPIDKRVIYIGPDELEYNNIVGMCHAGKISATTPEESCAETALSTCRIQTNFRIGGHRSETSRRFLGELSESMPRGKALAELFAIQRSTQQMSLEREVLPDRTKA